MTRPLLCLLLLARPACSLSLPAQCPTASRRASLLLFVATVAAPDVDFAVSWWRGRTGGGREERLRDEERIDFCSKRKAEKID